MTAIPSAKQYHFIVPVWGASYIDLFLRFFIPNMMAPGNLPAFSERHDLIFKIYTRSQASDAISGSPAYAALSKMLPAEIHVLDDALFNMPGADSIALMNQCHCRALDDAERVDGALIILTPDAIIADGTLMRLSEIIHQGKRVVMLFGPRVVQESVLPLLESRIAARGAGALHFTPRELARLLIEHLHPVHQSRFWDAERFNNKWPFALFWRGDGGFLARSFSLHPLLVHPRVKGVRPERVVDSRFVAEAFFDFDDFYVVTDSDDMIACSFTHADHFKDTPLETFEPHRAALIDVVEFAHLMTDPVERLFFSFPIAFHAQDITDSWKSAFADADRIARRVLEVFDPPPMDCRSFDADSLTARSKDISTRPVDALRESINNLNKWLERNSHRADLTPEHVMELVRLHEKAGLYEQAEHYLSFLIQEQSSDYVNSKAKMLRRKREKKERDMTALWEKNLFSIKKSFRTLYNQLMVFSLKTGLVAGDDPAHFRPVLATRILCSGNEIPFYRLFEPEEEMRGRVRTDLTARLATLAGHSECILSINALPELPPNKCGRTCRDTQPAVYFLIEPETALFAAALCSYDLSARLEEKSFVPFVGGDYDTQFRTWFEENPNAHVPEILTALSSEVRMKIDGIRAELILSRHASAGVIFRGKL